MGWNTADGTSAMCPSASTQIRNMRRHMECSCRRPEGGGGLSGLWDRLRRLDWRRLSCLSVEGLAAWRWRARRRLRRVVGL